MEEKLSGFLQDISKKKKILKNLQKTRGAKTSFEIWTAVGDRNPPCFWRHFSAWQIIPPVIIQLSDGYAYRTDTRIIKYACHTNKRIIRTRVSIKYAQR